MHMLMVVVLHNMSFRRKRTPPYVLMSCMANLAYPVSQCNIKVSSSYHYNIHAFYKAPKLIQRLHTLLQIAPPPPYITLLCSHHNGLHIALLTTLLPSIVMTIMHTELIQFVIQKCDHLHPKLQGYSIQQNDILGCKLHSLLAICIWWIIPVYRNYM